MHGSAQGVKTWRCVPSFCVLRITPSVFHPIMLRSMLTESKSLMHAIQAHQFGTSPILSHTHTQPPNPAKYNSPTFSIPSDARLTSTTWPFGRLPGQAGALAARHMVNACLLYTAGTIDWPIHHRRYVSYRACLQCVVCTMKCVQNH